MPMAIAQTTGRVMTSLRCFFSSWNSSRRVMQLAFHFPVRIDKTVRMLSHLFTETKLYT